MPASDHPQRADRRQPVGPSDDAALGMLLAAQLHPTLARITILRVLMDAGQRAIGTNDVYHALVARGTQVAMSTVYYTLQDLETRGIALREWEDGHRKAMYRVKPKELDDPACVRLVCRQSARIVMLGDAGLHAHLLQAAANAGVDLEGQVLSIGVSHLKAPGANDARGPRLVSRRS